MAKPNQVTLTREEAQALAKQLPYILDRLEQGEHEHGFAVALKKGQLNVKIQKARTKGVNGEQI